MEESLPRADCKCDACVRGLSLFERMDTMLTRLDAHLDSNTRHIQEMKARDAEHKDGMTILVGRMVAVVDAIAASHKRLAQDQCQIDARLTDTARVVKKLKEDGPASELLNLTTENGQLRDENTRLKAQLAEQTKKK
jgi:hypothetical protein